MTAPTQTTRQHLARTTRALHEALHCNPVFWPLTTPSLTRLQYHRALATFAAFYEGVEEARMKTGVWSAFSVAQECAALRVDLPEGSDGSAAIGVSFDTPDDTLGGLYVAQGAGFGRASFRRNAINALPDASHEFVSMDGSPRQWRKLIAALEQAGTDADARHRISRGAMGAFRYVTDIARLSHKPL